MISLQRDWNTVPELKPVPVHHRSKAKFYPSNGAGGQAAGGHSNTEYDAAPVFVQGIYIRVFHK